MIRVILTAFALLAFTGTPSAAQPQVAQRGDGVPIAYFYGANKGIGYTPGSTWVIIESADGNGSAVAEAVIGPRGAIVAVVLVGGEYNGGFTPGLPPIVTIVDTTGRGRGAVYEAVLEQ